MTETAIYIFVLLCSYLVVFYLGRYSFKYKMVYGFIALSKSYFERLDKADKNSKDAMDFLKIATQLNLELQLELGELILGEKIERKKKHGA